MSTETPHTDDDYEREQDPDHDTASDDLPYDPRTGFHGYRVTLQYRSHYKPDDGLTTTTGPTRPAESTAGESVAIFDPDHGERILVVGASGAVYSITGDGPGQRTVLGSRGEVLAVREVTDE